MDTVLEKRAAESDSDRPKRLCPVDCPSCDHDRDTYPARFSELTLPRGAGLPETRGNHHQLLFVLDGVLRVRWRGVTRHVYPGHALFRVRGAAVEVLAAEPSQVMLLGFANRVVLGKYDWLAGIARHGSRSQGEPLPVLRLDAATMGVLLSVMPIESPCYHIVKQYDLFIHLAAAHPEADLARFFYPILRASDDFRAFVIHNYTNGDSLENIAAKTHLSKSYFMRRFKEEFGMTAHQWLVEQKKRELVRMIAVGHTQTKTLADTLGFSDLPGLYQFCRKHFGCSITALVRRHGQPKVS